MQISNIKKKLPKAPWKLDKFRFHQSRAQTSKRPEPLTSNREHSLNLLVIGVRLRCRCLSCRQAILSFFNIVGYVRMLILSWILLRMGRVFVRLKAFLVMWMILIRNLITNACLLPLRKLSAWCASAGPSRILSFLFILVARRLCSYLWSYTYIIWNLYFHFNKH